MTGRHHRNTQAVPAAVAQAAYTDFAAPALQESVRLTNAAGQTWQAPAAAKYRPDVAGYFVNQALVRSGFDVELDLSGFAGAYTLSLEAERGKRRWQCKLRQDLVVGPPTSG